MCWSFRYGYLGPCCLLVSMVLVSIAIATRIPVNINQPIPASFGSQSQSELMEDQAIKIQNRLSFCFDDNSTDKTRALYVHKPYPPRLPSDGVKGMSIISELGSISHFIFGGKPRPGIGTDVFRILVAGCGTGDTLIQHYIALGKSNIRSEVIGLDLSKESLRIALSRLDVMWKKHSYSTVTVRVIEGQIENLADQAFRISNEIELMDFIECGGVLHHLPSPEKGLSALFSVLKPHGGIGLMVYGKYGRNGVYETQQLLKLLRMYVLEDDGSELPLDNWIAYTNPFLEIVPESHPSKRTSAANFHSHEIADMFLHTCDRPYTVQDVWNFAHSNDKSAFRGWLHPNIYDMNPTYYKIAPQYQRLPLLAKWSFTEIFLQRPSLHFFYVTNREWRERPPIPVVESYNLSTVLCPWFGGLYLQTINEERYSNPLFMEEMEKNSFVLRDGAAYVATLSDDEIYIDGFRNVEVGDYLIPRDPLLISLLSKLSCIPPYDDVSGRVIRRTINRSLYDIYQLLLKETGYWFQSTYTNEYIFLDSVKTSLRPLESFHLWYAWGGL